MDHARKLNAAGLLDKEGLKTEAEAAARLPPVIRSLLAGKYHPAGFNVGLNDGRATGQTVPHVHVIPK